VSTDEFFSEDYLNEGLARMLHENQRAAQHLLKDPLPSPPYDALDDEGRETILSLVLHIRLGGSPEMAHKKWVDRMAAKGYVYGKAKDPIARTHPCMVEYHDLSVWERRKILSAFRIVYAFTMES
jgi:hypothetical protein